MVVFTVATWKIFEFFVPTQHFVFVCYHLYNRILCANSFFSSIYRLWNFLPVTCIPANYNRQKYMQRQWPSIVLQCF